MKQDPALINFIIQNEQQDTNKLLLAAQKYPGINMPYAVEQIIARRQIREKLPSWYTQKEIVYPSRLATEQCSSELTASYKKQLVWGNTLCDLTGGLGVDSYFFSQQAQKIIYIEQNPEYCEAAKSNFTTLGATNIQVINQNVINIVDSIKADTCYIDPARRSATNKRVFALNDCEPDILQLKTNLLKNSHRLIVKISPMADIVETLRLLPETIEIHILSVKNECKELLFILENNKLTDEPTIHTINFTSDKKQQTFSFHLSAEKKATILPIDHVEKFLYEPNSSILKSGAFKLVATRYDLHKLHQHSHLYTSKQPIIDFPGRSFSIEQCHEFSTKKLKQLAKILPKANIATRNFPLSVSELRQKSGIIEGGDSYLFATTLYPRKTVLIQTQKLIF